MLLSTIWYVGLYEYCERILKKRRSLCKQFLEVRWVKKEEAIEVSLRDVSLS